MSYHCYIVHSVKQRLQIHLQIVQKKVYLKFLVTHFFSFEAPSLSPFLSECSSAQDEPNQEQSMLPVETSIPQTAVSTSDIASKLAPASWTGISNQNASCPTTLPVADRVEFTNKTVCKTYSWEITWRTPM